VKVPAINFLNINLGSKILRNVNIDPTIARDRSNGNTNQTIIPKTDENKERNKKCNFPISIFGNLLLNRAQLIEDEANIPTR